MHWREMLEEYFSIEISTEGDVKALPQLIENYVPNMVYLPIFFLRLARDVSNSSAYLIIMKVQWKYEKECFETLAQIISDFYSLQKPPSPAPVDSTAASKPIETEEKKQLEWYTQHVIFPAIRSYLHPPTSYASDGTIIQARLCLEINTNLQVAALENLYKVFERC